MNNQAYILLWISGSLLSIFIIAILVAWLYGHISRLISDNINNRLGGMLSSYFHVEMEEQQQVILELNQYVRYSSIRKKILIDCIIQKGEDFIEDNQIQLMNLYKETGIKRFLVRRLSSKNDYTKALACRQLGDLRLYSTEPNIYNLISSKNNIVIYNALLALAKLGDINSLTKILVSNSTNIHLSFRAIIEVIVEFKGSKESKEAMMIETIELSDDYFKGILIKAAADGQYEGLRDYYVKYLSSDNVNLKIACIRALSELNNSESEQHLIKMLESTAWEVRAAAAKGLEKVGTYHSYEPLVKLKSDEEWWVRQHAANSLSSIQEGKKHTECIPNYDNRYAREADTAVMEVLD